MTFVIVSLIIYRINQSLKKEVEKRTNELNIKNIELEKKQDIIEDNYRFKKQVVDNLGIGLITFDKDGYYTTINKRSVELIGLEQDLIGKQYSRKELDRYFHIDKIERCIKHGEKYRYAEKTFTRNDEETTYSYTLWPLYGDKGEHIGGVLTFRDITDVVTYEKKLNQKDKMESLGRLNVITLELPPLRERIGDISILLNYFLNKHNKKLDKNIKGFDKNIIKQLENYGFLGNIRRLKNLEERLVALSDKEYIGSEDLPEKYKGNLSIINSG